MEFFSQLFNSDWRQSGDDVSRTRQSRHFDSMAEQVMANRSEVLFLQSELDRVSQDLARSMVLNRTLIRLLLSEKICDPERLEHMLAETLAEGKEAMDSTVLPSKFCEDCGRPLPQPGQACPYCTEIAFTPTPEPAKKKSKKSKKKKTKKKAPSKSED